MKICTVTGHVWVIQIIDFGCRTVFRDTVIRRLDWSVVVQIEFVFVTLELCSSSTHHVPTLIRCLMRRGAYPSCGHRRWSSVVNPRLRTIGCTCFRGCMGLTSFCVRRCKKDEIGQRTIGDGLGCHDIPTCDLFVRVSRFNAVLKGRMDAITLLVMSIAIVIAEDDKPRTGGVERFGP